MQQKIEVLSIKQNILLPQILSIQQQKQILKCPNNYPANSVCISSQCSISGLMCLDHKCQCRKIHYKCHHILLDRVLQSIQKHHKQLPQKVKETYQTIYDMINQMIEKLSNLRTKFQRQQQYFGLRQQQLDFIELVSQNKIQEINGKIISSLQKTFDVDVQINKNTKEQIINDFQTKNKQFDKLCKYIENSYLQIKKVSGKMLKNFKMFNDSKIVQKQQERNLLASWVSQSFKDQKKQLKSELLFRASQHNFSAKEFHKFCDSKINTLTIVKNQYDKVIGGFVTKPWLSQSTGYVKDQTKLSFAFSLSLSQKYQCINWQRSMQCHPTYGPIIGGGYEIWLYDKCNENKSSSGKLGHSYNLKSPNGNNKYEFNNINTNNLWTGNPNGANFSVKQYQVYQIVCE